VEQNLRKDKPEYVLGGFECRPYVGHLVIGSLCAITAVSILLGWHAKFENYFALTAFGLVAISELGGGIYLFVRNR
jgi:hypothetical protein